MRQKSLFAAIAAAALAVMATAGMVTSGGLARTAAATEVRATAATAGSATAGCGKAPALASGTHTIQSSGQTRSYILELPANYDSSHPYRLIFGFHWVGGTAQDVDSGGSDGYIWSYYGLRAQANNSTIFVAPQGISNGWANTNGQDVTFVDDMLSQFEAGLCIDTTQVFAMGFSYGGAMTYALACARPAVFRAVAVYSGANLSGCSGGTQPVAYIGLHGVEDTTLPIADGRALRDTFVRNNGCTPQNPPEPAPGSLTHIVTTYSGCRSGYPVMWAAFDNGHTPDPVDGTYATSGVRTWTKAVTWTFFSQFQSTIPGGTPTPTPTPTSPTPTPAPTTTTPAPSGTCKVTDTINAWNTGLTSNITITNSSATAINGWSLVFTLPSGQTITSGWNATYSPSSGQVTARNMSYNAQLAPGASVTIGFQASHTGNTAPPASFTLNGTTCATA